MAMSIYRIIRRHRCLPVWLFTILYQKTYAHNAAERIIVLNLDATWALALNSRGTNVDEIIERVWENILARPTGPLNLRLVIQPIVAGILAIRSGLNDARNGRPAFLWAAITNAAYRPNLLRQGWKDIGKVFVFAVVLDAVYQLIVQRGVYVLELLIVATSLAIVPYVLIRGPVTRIGKWLTRQTGPSSRMEGTTFRGEQNDKR